MAGIANPLRDLPTLYALLDAVEILVVDSFEKPEEREMYFTRTYAPPAGAMEALGDRASLIRGWSAEDEMAAYEDTDDDFEPPTG